jgi:hypothetical protein
MNVLLSNPLIAPSADLQRGIVFGGNALTSGHVPPDYFSLTNRLMYGLAYYKFCYSDEVVKELNIERARKAGSAKKTDALQEFIIDIMQEKPNTTTQELLFNLRHEAGHGVIKSVDDKVIEFFNDNDTVGSAVISGLKDRRRRAKQFLAQTTIARMS